MKAEWTRSFAMAAVTAAALVALPRSLSSQQAPLLRERLDDGSTPGLLLGLAPSEPPSVVFDTAVDTTSKPEAWSLDPVTGAYYRRGELLVKLSEQATAVTRAIALRAADVERVARSLPGNWDVLELRSGVPETTALAALLREPSVDAASLNYRAEPFQRRPNDEFFNLQWNLEAGEIPRAWEINPGATSSIIVAVVDTGLNTVSNSFTFFSPIGQFSARFATNPDLVSPTNIVRPYDFVYRDEFPVDLGGHGTHVAGTIAQLTNNNMGVAGVAYNVKLMPLKVISGGSFGSWDAIFFPSNRAGSADIVAEAIIYAANNGAHVINLSLGGPGPAPIVRDAIRYAVNRGSFVAIAAGNDGDRGNPVMYPAAYAAEIGGAMTVGAVNRSLRRASYSGFQPYVEVCAPGGETSTLERDYQGGISQSTYAQGDTLWNFNPGQMLQALRGGFRPRFDRFFVIAYDGTSMATPHVAGIAALLYSQGIRNPGAIEEAIKRFARPIGARRDECGAGLIDARAALRGLGVAR